MRAASLLAYTGGTPGICHRSLGQTVSYSPSHTHRLILTVFSFAHEGAMEQIEEDIEVHKKISTNAEVEISVLKQRLKKQERDYQIELNETKHAKETLEKARSPAGVCKRC